jgi:DNA-binding GntR family transcriptional regulator
LATKLTPIDLVQTLKYQVYSILKDVTARMGINSTPELPKLDERRLAKALGVSRTPQPAGPWPAH